MMYISLIEPTGTGFSAYFPDLNGCIASGTTREELEKNLKEVLQFHLDGMREDGISIPKPTSKAEFKPPPPPVEVYEVFL
jgi:predicted RNase H-like HicB family nuclease